MLDATDEDISKLKQTQSAEAKEKVPEQDLTEEDQEDDNFR